HHLVFSFFFFHVTPTTDFSTLSLHDALPIFVDVRPWTSRRGPLVHHQRADRGSPGSRARRVGACTGSLTARDSLASETPCMRRQDRKSTRLNSSHVAISYAVFCLKKKKINVK